METSDERGQTGKGVGMTSQNVMDAISDMNKIRTIVPGVGVDVTTVGGLTVRGAFMGADDDFIHMVKDDKMARVPISGVLFISILQSFIVPAGTTWEAGR